MRLNEIERRMAAWERRIAELELFTERSVRSLAWKCGTDGEAFLREIRDKIRVAESKKDETRSQRSLRKFLDITEGVEGSILADDGTVFEVRPKTPGKKGPHDEL